MNNYSQHTAVRIDMPLCGSICGCAARYVAARLDMIFTVGEYRGQDHNITALRRMAQIKSVAMRHHNAAYAAYHAPKGAYRVPKAHIERRMAHIDGGSAAYLGGE